jgi:hypothetical protein
VQGDTVTVATGGWNTASAMGYSDCSYRRVEYGSAMGYSDCSDRRVEYGKCRIVWFSVTALRIAHCAATGQVQHDELYMSSTELMAGTLYQQVLLLQQLIADITPHRGSHCHQLRWPGTRYKQADNKVLGTMPRSGGLQNRLLHVS